MVITELIGGLGNQMFQYAAGRAVSLERNVPLLLDTSNFENYGLHQGFELGRVFNCVAGIATEEDVRSILGWQYTRHVRQFLARRGLAALRREQFVVEPYFHFWPGIGVVPSDCYLSGYWQSEKYFVKSSEQIRMDFSFRIAPSPQNVVVARKMQQVTAVSLHVRRGDYVSNPQTTATHGLCSLDYYLASIKYVADRVQNPHFFIFSDDITWVKNNLKTDFSCDFIDWNQGLESYNDMRLMSMCRHHIIANSSFSWWAAWLNPRLDKIVVAPSRWFVNQNNVRDLLPEDWVRL